MDLCLQRLMKWRFKLTRVTANESSNVEVTDGFEIDAEEVIVTKSKFLLEKSTKSSLIYYQMN